MEKPEEELENQLHQQYAENDNSRSGVFTSFIIGIVALFGFYGYVFVNTYKRYWKFDAQEFLLMSFITIGILFFLAILALNLGYSLRRDHFIVYNIRKERYGRDKTEMRKIFGKLYKPSGKNFLKFLPNYYNLFYWLFFYSEIFILITTKIKICDIGINNTEIIFSRCESILYRAVIPFHIFFIILTLIFRLCSYCKYRRNIKKIRTRKVTPSVVTL
jgi:preprotein translocase subunit SecG